MRKGHAALRVHSPRCGKPRPELRRSMRTVCRRRWSCAVIGIIGSRWEKVIPGGYSPLTRFVNADWTGPLPEETPDRFETADGGAYW